MVMILKNNILGVHMVRFVVRRSVFWTGAIAICIQFAGGQANAKNTSSLPLLKVKEPVVIRPQGREGQAPPAPGDEAKAFLLSSDESRDRAAADLADYKAYLAYFHPEEKEKLVKNLGLLSRKDHEL